MGSTAKRDVIARSEATWQSPVGFTNDPGGDCHVGWLRLPPRNDTIFLVAAATGRWGRYGTFSSNSFLLPINSGKFPNFMLFFGLNFRMEYVTI